MDQPIHQVIEQQVIHSARKTAVLSEGTSLTYDALNRKANRLARWLNLAGIEPESTVAILMEPSCHLPVAVLGILKSGGAYVPLDPASPPAHRQYILENTRAGIILTMEKFRTKLACEPATIFCLDSHQDSLAGFSPENPGYPVSSRNSAYILYTSGTTGPPKGVIIEHRSLSHYLNWYCEILYKQTGAILPLTSSICFAAAVNQLYPSLILGHELNILPGNIARQPERLLRWYENKSRQGLYCVPTLWEELVAVAERLKQEGFRPGGPACVYLSGEAVPQKLVERTFALWPDLPLWNLYGPTEMTSNASAVQLKVDRKVSLGIPIHKTVFYILDQKFNPVQAGEAGELYISGPGMARGYINNPALTEERFIKNHFTSAGNERLYKSGDIVRKVGECLEFLGRNDNQVNIRGYRIELEGIESVLRSHPRIRKAAVTTYGEELSRKSLVAYFVPGGEKEVSTERLKNYLAEYLPEYMLPSFYVPLSCFPLLGNGKINYHALPCPEHDNLVYESPRTALETALEKIWAEILKKKQVSLEANFFGLGGNSLLAARVITRIRRELNRDVTFRQIFDAPSLRAFAAGLEGKGTSSHLPPIAAAPPNSGGFPLSCQQERLWFLQQLNPELRAYNIRFGVRLAGHLEKETLHRALNYLLLRHETLRTTFVLRENNPVQIIHPLARVNLPLLNLKEVARGRETERFRTILRETEDRPFNLSVYPLIRFKLYRIHQDDHALLVTVHHIVFDGFSKDIFLRELITGYNALLQKKHPLLPPLDIRYKDFCRWQQNYLQGRELDDLVTFWKNVLRDHSGKLELTTDRPRPPVQTYRGKVCRMRIGHALRNSIGILGRETNATPFTVFMAAFHVLLFRYTSQPDIIVACPAQNRLDKKLEGLIGFFVNTLLIPARLSEETRFRDFLRELRQMILDAFDHQALPFKKLVEKIRPGRSLNYNPLFQVMLNYQPSSPALPPSPGLSFSLLEVETDTAPFDLTLEIREQEQGSELLLNYNPDLFNESTAEGMLIHYITLLKGICATPDLEIADFTFLTHREREKILYTWNDTRKQYDRNKCIHHLIEDQVRRTPEAPAVTAENRTLSYRELDNRANQLARYLIHAGVQPETPVGIYMDRSPEMVIALLGTLKSGGAYLPLDPGYPGKRLAYMLEDMKVSFILSRGNSAQNLPFHSAQVIYLDSPDAEIASESSAPLMLNLNGGNLAYIMYTSGSTGNPKGTLLNHRGICNYLLWMQGEFSLSGKDSVLQKTSINFDISVWELFWPLISGARLVLAQPHGHLDPEYLVNTVIKEEITTIQFVPSMLRLFLEEPGVRACHSLRRLFSGGEELGVPLKDKVFQKLNVQLCNLYGPTETSIFSAYHICSEGDDRHFVPLGKPIYNTSIYILDQRLKPVPPGVKGEIHIGGEGVARGYFGNPDLNNRKFIPDIFAPEPGQTLYKTGDYGCYADDGTIQFLGRCDNQIKIRGCRVEIREVEFCLRTHHQIQEAVVTLHKQPPGAESLVAYIVAAPGAAPEERDLREFLKRVLPLYMIPSGYILLKSIPLLPNGKANRKALPPPNFCGSQPAPPEREALSANQEIISTIWKLILRQEHIELDRNFFDIGGHSLMLVQVRNRIREYMGRDISIVDMFRYPTIRSLAGYLSVPKTAAPAVSDYPRRLRMQQRAWENLKQINTRFKE